MVTYDLITSEHVFVTYAPMFMLATFPCAACMHADMDKLPSLLQRLGDDLRRNWRPQILGLKAGVR